MDYNKKAMNDLMFSMYPQRKKVTETSVTGAMYIPQAPLDANSSVAGTVVTTQQAPNRTGPGGSDNHTHGKNVNEFGNGITTIDGSSLHVHMIQDGKVIPYTGNDQGVQHTHTINN